MVNPQQGHEEHIGNKMSSRRFSTTWSGVLFIIKESTFWTWSRLDISATSPSVAAGNYQPNQLDWVLITYVIFWLNMQHFAHSHTPPHQLRMRNITSSQTDPDLRNCVPGRQETILVTFWWVLYNINFKSCARAVWWKENYLLFFCYVSHYWFLSFYSTE